MTGVVPWGIGPGLLAWSVVGSRSDTASGHAASVRYNLQQKKWGMGASWRQEGAGYAALSDPVVPGPRRDSAGLYGSLQLGDWGGLSLSFSRQATQLTAEAAAAASASAERQVRQSTNLGWSRGLGKGNAHWLRVDLTRTREGSQVAQQVGLALSFSLDARTRLTLNGSGNPDQQAGNGSLQLSRPLWPGETWGWELGLDRSAAAGGGQTVRRAAADMQAQTMQLRGDWRNSGSGASSDALRLTAGGGVAIVGGSVHFSRPIGDAYAIARVGGPMNTTPASFRAAAKAEFSERTP
jgi:outer membrane usher protein FimD/PapC